MSDTRHVSDSSNTYTEIEENLDEADRAAELEDIRYTGSDVFDRARNKIHSK